MKKIQVLGGGCARCDVLSQETIKAAESLGLSYELEKITDYAEIAKFGIMSTPALVIDGTVVFSGQVLKSDEIKKFLVQL